jgi:hypothetical protein
LPREGPPAAALVSTPSSLTPIESNVPVGPSNPAAGLLENVLVLGGILGGLPVSGGQGVVRKRDGTPVAGVLFDTLGLLKGANFDGAVDPENIMDTLPLTKRNEHAMELGKRVLEFVGELLGVAKLASKTSVAGQTLGGVAGELSMFILLDAWVASY